jgi:hypothetical protein
MTWGIIGQAGLELNIKQTRKLGGAEITFLYKISHMNGCRDLNETQRK